MNFLPDFLFSNYIYLVVGFVILIKGADVMVSGASALAARFGISPLVIGLTIVAFGTSAPEFFVNVFSAFKGETDLALANIMGSNIANTWLVLGAAAVLYPLKAQKSTIFKEVPFSFLASILVALCSLDIFLSGATENVITRAEGLILLLFFVIFFVYTFSLSKNTDPQENDISSEQEALWKSFGSIVLGLTGLGVGADLLVGSSVNIAESFGVSEAIIGLTIVAFGTSAPELVTSIVASYKRQADIAIGNIVGSNIFNLLFVLGSTAVVSNIFVSADLLFDIYVELACIFLLLLSLFFFGKKGVITRMEGAIFLLLYFLYIAYKLYVELS